MRGETMADELVAGTLVVVHKPEPPSSSEWTVHCREIAKRRPGLRGVIVVANGSGPNTLQRQELQEVWGAATPPPIAIMTRSSVLRGVLTALNWFMSNRLKAFRETDFDGAFDYLGLEASARTEVMVAMRKPAADLGVPLREAAKRAHAS